MPLQYLMVARLDGTVYPGVHVPNRDVLLSALSGHGRTRYCLLIAAWSSRSFLVVATARFNRRSLLCRHRGSDFAWSASAPFAGTSEFAWAWFHHRSTDISSYPFSTPRLPAEAEWDRISPAVAPRSRGYRPQSLTQGQADRSSRTIKV